MLKEVYEKNTIQKVDRLWVMFDKDSFTAQDFNAPIQRCETASIGCAWSNEAFELWYLLHFQYYEHAMSRQVYKEMIEKYLNPFRGNEFTYEKNSLKMYDLLKKYSILDDAVRNAKWLTKKFVSLQDYANHNPCTMVWALAEELMKLKEE